VKICVNDLFHFLSFFVQSVLPTLRAVLLGAQLLLNVELILLGNVILPTTNTALQLEQNPSRFLSHS